MKDVYTEQDISELKTMILRVVPAVKEIILFGSYAKGTASSGSDLDILLLFSEDPDWRTRRDILNRLYRLMAKEGYCVDFVLKSKSGYVRDMRLPTLSRTISREGRMLWMQS